MDEPEPCLGKRSNDCNGLLKSSLYWGADEDDEEEVLVVVHVSGVTGVVRLELSIIIKYF